MSSAVVLSAVLVLVAVVDQLGAHSLGNHAIASYARYGAQAQPGVLYGVVYAVAVVGAALWLLVLRALRARRRSTAVLAGTATAITAAVAALLLGASEYGASIFPPQWGLLALLPAAAGAVAVFLLLRPRRAPAGRSVSPSATIPDSPVVER